MSPQNLSAAIGAVRERVARAAAAAGRSAHSVTLLAVGKGQPAELLARAADCGLEHFGESYLQEALAKVAALRERRLTWHFIGRVQANKTRSIAEHFAWVHALDRPKIAERLAAQRPPHAPPLNVCLQVNVACETGKGGATPAEVPALARAVAQLPRLALRGLMCIPPEQTQVAQQRAWFARLRVLAEELNAAGHRLDTLSMGMSGDFEAAILEGATLVRIGTALFGPRPE
ncbi:MAG TPA: YggS family pyridoxal phosphate-dependent enzyme [Steroidobacteraceae bacterium]|jgi:pyridoxal phosphate enzyme (YggS family)|nr:YggS family pyridoxal phosphate-dependent enzyme [Steroidobacteraceae bacterium]